MWDIIEHNDNDEHKQLPLKYWSQTECYGIYFGDLRINPGVTNVFITNRHELDSCEWNFPHLLRFWLTRYAGDTHKIHSAFPYTIKQAIAFLIEDGKDLSEIEGRIIPVIDAFPCCTNRSAFGFDTQEL
jgi:hypothetical protein